MSEQVDDFEEKKKKDLNKQQKHWCWQITFHTNVTEEKPGGGGRFSKMYLMTCFKKTTTQKQKMMLKDEASLCLRGKLLQTRPDPTPECENLNTNIKVSPI